MGGPQYLTHKNSKYTQLCTLKYDCEHSIIPLKCLAKNHPDILIAPFILQNFFYILIDINHHEFSIQGCLSFEL